MGVFFSTRKNFHFYLYETWILILEQLEIGIVAFALNFAFLGIMFRTYVEKFALEPAYASRIDLFMRLLGDNVYDRWWPALAMVCLKISLIAYIICLSAALLFQFLYLIRFVFRHMGLLSRIVFFIAPVAWLVAMAVRYKVPFINLAEALEISIIPAVFLSYKCFKDARLFMPELGRVLSAWVSRHAKHEPVANPQQTQMGDGSSRNQKDPLDDKYGKILALKGDMTREDIRRRYRDLVKQYHPDKVHHLGQKLKDVAENEMRLINEAYAHFARKYDL